MTTFVSFRSCVRAGGACSALGFCVIIEDGLIIHLPLFLDCC
jgi:hypothetical protein